MNIINIFNLFLPSDDYITKQKPKKHNSTTFHVQNIKKKNRQYKRKEEINLWHYKNAD